MWVSPTRAVSEITVTTRPHFASIIAGSAARTAYITPYRLTRMNPSQSAGSVCTRVARSSMPIVAARPALPALFTRMSIGAAVADRRHHRVVVGDVEHRGASDATGVLDRTHHPFGALEHEVVHQHLGAGLGQRRGDLLADALARAGHQGAVPGEIDLEGHRCSCRQTASACVEVGDLVVAEPGGRERGVGVLAQRRWRSRRERRLGAVGVAQVHGRAQHPGAGAVVELDDRTAGLDVVGGEQLFDGCHRPDHRAGVLQPGQPFRGRAGGEDGGELGGQRRPGRRAG